MLVNLSAAAAHHTVSARGARQEPMSAVQQTVIYKVQSRRACDNTDIVSPGMMLVQGLRQHLLVLLNSASEWMDGWHGSQGTLALYQVQTLIASQAVKPGGRVVYSTCSISPVENDEVVAKALANIQGQLQVGTDAAMQHLDQQHAPSAGLSVLSSVTGLIQQLGAEATEHGFMILPDQTGAGPMYVCLLVKNA